MMRRTTVFGLSVAGLILSVVAAATIASAYAGQTTRVSVNSSGVAANASGLSGVLSSDGRYVVFHSSATNLVSGVSGTHVYRHDRVTGATVLVDLATTGLPSSGPSLRPTVSADGRYVAFDSFASDLVAGDTNGLLDVFVRDMQSTASALASSSATGVPGNFGSNLSGQSGAHGISDDGRYVAFLSLATNFVAESNNGMQQVYVKDMATGTVVRASVNDLGDAGNADSQTPAISGNGRFVAFGSASSNLSPLSNNFQVFVRDLVGGTTTLESPGAAGTLRTSTLPALSFDGRFIAFESGARLDPRDLDNGTLDVFLRDRDTGTTVLASLSTNSVAGATSSSPSISGDGRWVGFQSFDEKLVPVDTNGFIDVFLYDRLTEAITLVSRNDADQQANMPSNGASVSFDGGLVLFGSTASNLVAPPQGAGNQLYVRNLKANQAPVLPSLGRDVVLTEGQPLSLTWEFSDNDGSTAWSATVNYGDGSGTQELALNTDKTFVLQHLYAPGSWDLTVEVTDDAGATGALVIHVVVNNVDPTVNLVSALDLAFTRTLDAAGSFTDPGLGSDETHSATVTYGDSTGTQALALAGGSFALHHTYAAAGSYTVAVTVSDSNGGSTTATMVVNVGDYTYQWLDPVGTAFVVGRNLPAKFQVFGPDGSPVLDESVRVDVVDESGGVLIGYVFGDQPSRWVTWSNDSYHVNVDTKDLAPGTYWLRVRFSSPALTGEFTLGTTGTASSMTRSRIR